MTSKESPVFVSTYGGGIRRKGRLGQEVERIFRAGNGPAICEPVGPAGVVRGRADPGSGGPADVYGKSGGG